MRKLLFVSLCMSIFCWAAKPMESIDKYNVILVHGTDNSAGGFSCDEVAEDDAYTKYEKFFDNPKLSWKLGNSPGMLGAYDNEDGLTHWLNTKIFEYEKNPVNEKDPFDFSHIYLQRSFSNPANSPAYNAHELGDRTWKGENKCNERRSLIEEAQEVRAKGRKNLSDLRKSVTFRDSLPPSRNILIAHSMGGLASREYVQGTGYNNDVDKIITLDSPHEGTGAVLPICHVNI